MQVRGVVQSKQMQSKWMGESRRLSDPGAQQPGLEG
jgi:hypothetical protein